MSKIRFQVAYDGPALAEHGMDVYTLAPALLAFGDLVREANTQINGDRAKVNVLVTEDFEHKCFNINFEILQTIYDFTKDLLADGDVKTAKDILEWLGIIAGVGGVPIGGLLAYLKLRQGRKIESATEIKDEGQGGNVSVTFEGDRNSVTVNQNVYHMGENPRIRSAVSRTLEPLEQEGVDQMRFQQNEEELSAIGKGAAHDIRLSCTPQLGEEEAFEPQAVVAHLKVYSPVFEENAEKWRFDYGGKHIHADITDTDIAQKALERGFVAVGDIYRVKLQITEHKTASGQFRNDYRVLEVLELLTVGDPTRQTSLFSDLDKG